ncbi:ribosomal protein S18 acetylase RimI-like enzyme [Pseudaminobacter salicylatoxidans]|uniref:Ribosomal protein S18 acetylase RimI-like enzyme n=1 Tax=Pseudaminobacter salicylatoxidans TaxID=93369 RepID=A0A316C6A9_PSESE|nr:GNAT family N-acetyltransferase [Pseudaminobacter salicylatoxidans]PWJ85260.1 ribosomal protein S18 acetylase RimI-like enzyme [Pseudaminobacter salicylatoxidans]
MSAKIRPARSDDTDALVAVETLAFLNRRTSRRAFRHMIRSRSVLLLVACDNGVLEGYCAVFYRAGSPWARLHSLAVDPVNGRGLGRELLAEAEKAAAAKGCEAMRVDVRLDNLRAINRYENGHYRRFAARRNHYADGMTALCYEKRLQPPSRMATSVHHG